MTPTSSTHDQNLTLPMKIASAGLAGCTADIFTFPLDTVKVWLQVSGESKASTAIKTTSTKATPITAVRPKFYSVPPAVRYPLAPGTKPGNFRSTGTKQSAGGKITGTATKKTVQASNAARGARISVKLGQHLPTKSKSMTGVNKKYSSVVSSFKPNRAIGRFSAFETSAANLNGAVARASPGMVQTVVNGVRSNGFLSLYGGLGAGLQRQVAFCAVRIGLYDTVRDFYYKQFPGKPGGKHIPQRILAGSTTAFVAVALFQPTEVVKIRMQAQTRMPKSARTYSSSLQAYRQLFKVGGFKELWKGVETNAARLGVVNVSELVTYDLVKEAILDWKLLEDTPVCHFTSAFISGFITTLIASPIDVVKTRYMNSQMNQYRGPIHCAKNMLFNEGLRSFYKGFVPSYLRLGSWNIVMFVSYEQYKILSKRFSAVYDSPSSNKHTNPDVP